MSLQSAETIDVHAHAVLDETMGAAGSHGPELTAESPPRFRAGDYELIGVKYRGSAFMDPELRLQAMDTAGIDYQVLSPNPLTYFHFIDAKDAQNFCRVHNDALARNTGCLAEIDHLAGHILNRCGDIKRDPVAPALNELF